MSYAVVPMTEAHLDQIEEIENICFTDPWSRQLLDGMLTLPGAIALSAIDTTGAVLGYISAQTVLDEGYINNVAVRPQSRRMGVASALLAALRQQALEQELAFLTLEVRASNRAAQALYREHGYLEVGCRRSYYAHPKEDAILMTLELRTCIHKK